MSGFGLAFGAITTSAVSAALFTCSHAAWAGKTYVASTNTGCLAAVYRDRSEEQFEGHVPVRGIYLPNIVPHEREIVVITVDSRAGVVQSAVTKRTDGACERGIRCSYESDDRHAVLRNFKAMLVSRIHGFTLCTPCQRIASTQPKLQ